MKKYDSPHNGDKILWCRFEAYGDVLQALAEAYVVKTKFPNVKIGFLTREKYADIAKAQPYIDEVICGEKHPFSVLLKTASLIRRKKYDWICSTMQGGHFSVLALLAGAKYRLSDTRYLSLIDTYNAHEWASAHDIDLYARTERTLFPASTDEVFAKDLLSPLEGKKKIFCIVGASKVFKIWPAEHWIDLLKPLTETGWCAVLNAFGTVEKQYADKIAAALPAGCVLNLTNKLTFSTVTAVADQCNVVVGSDTGPMHTALLCGLPGICICEHHISKDVGYNMPWLTLISSDIKKTTENKDMPISTISPKIVREKFDELVEKYKL